MTVLPCPHCGNEKAYELEARPKFCTRCGRPLPAPAKTSAPPVKSERAGHQQYLDEILAHWQGTHVPAPDIGRISPRQGQILFDAYQHDLSRGRYDPAYKPGPRERLAFASAYLLLKQGKRDLAVDWLRDQTEKSPRFADPWIWLAAASDDQAERIDYLETAVLLEPSHPLAREAFSIATGRVSPNGRPAKRNAGPRFRVVKCPQCGGALRYEPGATEVECQFCGRPFELEGTDLLEQQNGLLGELRLTRRFQGSTWREVSRIAHCQSCGAELTMTHHLARQCLFCGSTSVLIEDLRQALIQPDGFLPFKIDQEQAAKAIRRSLRAQRPQSPGGARPERPQGIYLPYWVFDGFVEARYQPETLEGVLAPNRRPEPYRRLLMFDNLLYSAMERPFSRLLEGILPYKLHRLVPYDAHLLADWAAAIYRRDVEQVVDEARDAMLQAAVRRTRQSSPEAFKSWNTKRSYQITAVTYQLVLLPVWTVVVGPRRERTVVMVNGQTGEVASGSLARRNKR
jgi:hypothetical protein